MFDFDQNDDQLTPLRRMGVHPMFDIAAPGPQRQPAELPGIDVSPGSPSSPKSPGSEEAAPKLSMGAPADVSMSRSSDAPSMAAPSQDSSPQPRAAALHSSPGMSGPTLDDDANMHRNRLNYMRESGSGISQIHNHFLRGMARVGDIAGSMFFPYQMASIPGTELHHRQLMGQETGAINQDLGEEEKQRTIAHTGAETAHLGEEDKKIEQDLNAPEHQSPEEQAYAAELKKTGDPMQAFRNVMQAKEKPVAPKEGEMPLGDRVGQLNEAMQRRYQVFNPNQKLPEDLTLQPNATAKDFDRIDKIMQQTEGARGTKAQQDHANAIRDAMLTIAKQNQADREKAAEEKKNKPSPDEQKRADLARNMSENLDQLEEIVSRRPDLFGPIAGRLTKMKMAAGSDDPDIGALSTIEHMLGMVQQSTHGMRSAHGVEAAAHSITQGFHSQPAALKGAIAAARASIRTFTEDAERGKGGGGAPAGTIHYIVGKDSYDIPPEKEAKFKQKYPNAVKQ